MGVLLVGADLLLQLGNLTDYDGAQNRNPPLYMSLTEANFESL